MNGLTSTIINMAVACSIGSAAFAETLDEPYRVWVGADGAKVYSGPGNDYYTTQELSAGAECQVYEELRDGWLAIRPPAGSYSLVLRSALEQNNSGVARVKRDGTPSRVGSVLTDGMSSVHVRLDAGEMVQVIDDGAQSGSQWATVAPPAGEFRWIRAEDIVHSPRQVVDTTRDDWNASETQTAAATIDNEIVSFNTTSDGEFVRVSNEQPTAKKSDKDAPLASQANAPQTFPDSFSGQLDRIEIQLSRRVTGPVNLWVFDDLERETATLLSRAATAKQRQAVNDLANRMSRFAAIGKRHRSDQRSTGVLPEQGITPLEAATNDPALAEFDAVGILRPVVSKHGNAPPYALVDDAGNVVTFITPAPSLNLQQLLGQRVGVAGTRGFLPEFRSRNIQTANVAPVDGLRRR